jgi:hypothetical protein
LLWAKLYSQFLKSEKDENQSEREVLRAPSDSAGDCGACDECGCDVEEEEKD